MHCKSLIAFRTYRKLNSKIIAYNNYFVRYNKQILSVCVCECGLQCLSLNIILETKLNN